MYRVLRNNVCKTHKDHKRVYLMGATNRGYKHNDPSDPMLYTKIGLSQNPIERLVTVESQSVSKYYSKRKEVKTQSGEEVWFPENFTLLGYTDPLPFAASVETMAHKILCDVYKRREALDAKVHGLKDWYRPTHVWCAAFSIFEAINRCYKELGVVKHPDIKWTVPKDFPNAGNSIISIKEDYLPNLKKYKKVRLGYGQIMENFVESYEVPTWSFNRWLLEKRPDVSMDDRAVMLEAVRIVINTPFTTSGKNHIYFENKSMQKAVSLFFEEFKKDKEFIASLGKLPA